MSPEEPELRDEQADQAGSARRSRRWWIIAAVCLAAIAVYFFWLNPQRQSSREASKSPQVSVSVVALPAGTSDFSIYLTGLGSVTPLNTVTVKTRVDGQLMEVLYREGQLVKKGDILASIDPRPFKVQLTQAEGQMARDTALLQNARVDLERYQVLWQQDSISKQQLDTQVALVHQYEGNVKADQGQIDSAKLQLVYCEITAPVSGRLGLRLVDPGNIVHASDATGLVVVTQLQPITVIFSISEDYLPTVVEKMKVTPEMAVEAYDRDQKRKLATGSLLTVDNTIDPNTGTVKLKALFPNSGNQLFPNQFVNARLLVNILKDVIVVPAAAIQRGPKGTFVYIVKADHTAGVRAVSVSEIQEGEAAIKTGLAAGELVVVEGAERLREGSKVELRQDKGTQRKGV